MMYLVSSTLTLPVNIFTWKKEKLCSPGETKFFLNEKNNKQIIIIIK